MCRSAISAAGSSQNSYGLTFERLIGHRTTDALRTSGSRRSRAASVSLAGEMRQELGRNAFVLRHLLGGSTNADKLKLGYAEVGIFFNDRDAILGRSRGERIFERKAGVSRCRLQMLGCFLARPARAV